VIADCAVSIGPNLGSIVTGQRGECAVRILVAIEGSSEARAAADMS
jgi:hypothetical protein